MKTIDETEMQKPKEKRKTKKEQGFYPNNFKFCADKNYFYHLELYNL